MSAVWQLAACEFRRRWRSVVVLVVFVGFIGAVVLATSAGARRTSSALVRLNSSSRAATVQLQVPTTATAAQLRELGHVPQVASFGLAGAEDVIDPSAPNLTIIAQPNTDIGTAVDRARVVAGRAANPAAVDEVAIDETVAAQLHRRVGDDLHLTSYTQRQITAVLRGGNPGQPAGPQVRLHIVGIVRRPFDLGRRGALGGITLLTPAFYRAYHGRIGGYPIWVIRIRTRDGRSDLPEIRAAAVRIFGPSPFLEVTDTAPEAGGAQDAIDVVTLALWILAGVAAAAGAVAIGIVLTREIALPTFDQDTLRALGMTRAQRGAIGAAQAVVIALGGAAFAATGAAFASGLFPIGIARLAEPDPGRRVDWPVVVVGFLAVVVLVLAVEFVTVLRNTRTVVSEADTRLSRRTAGAAAAVGLAPTVANGFRMAIEPGHGRSAVPVRSAFFGTVLGVFGLTAVLVFASSLTHLVTSPHLYGWTADFSAPENTTAPAQSCIRADYGLLREPGVGALASICEQTDDIEIDGHPATGWSFTPLRGDIEPTIVAGLPPDGPHDVALGATTLRTLGKHIGDTVVVAGPRSHQQYRIVGQVVLPTLGQIQPLADGAVFTGAGFAPVFDPSNYSRYLLGQFTPDANRAAVEHWIATNPQLGVPTVPSPPVEVTRIHQIAWLPTTLAVLFSVLAAIAVAHALITSVHRRRHELAVLKTLGFQRRQLRATVAWQATLLAATGLVIGIPTGVITGRLVWRDIATHLGVITTPTIPALALTLVVPATIALVNLVAFAPARAAAHTRAAVALRTQ